MKLSLNDLREAFMTPRGDHPASKGGTYPKGRTGHSPRLRVTKHVKRQTAKGEPVYYRISK